MDLRDSKVQKMLLVGLAALLLVYFWHSKVYQPNEENLDVKRTQYEGLMANLKTIELKAKSLAGLRKEYDKLLVRYENIEKLLPEEDKVPEFLMQLHAASMNSQSVVAEISPQSPSGEAFYNVTQYGIKFNGTYHELGQFLAGVANFPFITNVSELNIKGLPPTMVQQQTLGNNPADSDRQTVESDFYLSTYYVKPEEKLKGVQF
jgi:type IV pilus assembly protein PilO